MCVSSMLYDHFHEKWQDKWVHPIVQPSWPSSPNPSTPSIMPLTNEELTQLREDIKEFKILLEKAKKYDEEHNQKECELESKKEKLRKLAEELGVEIKF